MMQSRRIWTWAAVTAGLVAVTALAVALNLPRRLPEAPPSLPPAGPVSPVLPTSSDRASGVGAATNSGTPPLSSIFFLDGRHGWAGGAGVILGTVDGGRTWERQYTGAAAVDQLDFVDTEHGWARTAGGLLVTVDGGHTWTAVPSGPSDLTEVDFVSPQMGWGVQAGALVTTSDGGRTWSTVPSPGPVQSVCFGDDAHVGWAAGGSTVMETTDGGRTWAVAYRAPVQQGSQFNATVRCNGPTSAWVLLTGGYAMSHEAYVVFHTADGGKTWSEPLANAYFPGYPRAPQDIDSVAGAFVVLGQDGARFLGLCPVCGASPAVSLTSTGDGGRTVTHQDLYGIFGLPGGGGPALAFSDAENGWIVGVQGQQGRIYVTADGGRSWTQQYPPSGPVPMQAISMVGQENGYGLGTVGDAGAVLQTHNGGDTWSVVGHIRPGTSSSASASAASGFSSVGANPSLSLSFADSTDGWGIVSGVVEHTTDGGRTWAVASLPAVADQGFGSTDPEGVAFLPGGQVGCVQFGYWFPNPQAYLGTTDGGRTWTPVTMPGLDATLNANGHVVPGPGAAQGALACALDESARWPGALEAVAASGKQAAVLAAAAPNALWAAVVGEFSGQLMTTADGGKTWATYGIPGTAAIQSVSFADPEHGWLLMGDGELFRTGDGGTTWMPA